MAQDGDFVFDRYQIIFFGCVSTTVVSLYDEVLKPESGLVVPDNVNVVPSGLYINCAIVITTELLIPFSSEPTMQR